MAAEQFDHLKRLTRKRLVAASTLAGITLKQGWLTDYQIDQLLSGCGDELVIGAPYKARHITPLPRVLSE